MENKWMEMEMELQKTARKCHNINEYMTDDIKLLLKWDVFQSQPALTNICPISEYSTYQKTLMAYCKFEGMIYDCQY